MAKFILPYNIPSTPQSLRDSPGGALGTVFPRPLASLRTACAFSSTPQSLRDSPRWGHWGPYSPAPLRRSAPMGSFWVRLYWYIHLSKSKDFV